MEYEVGVFQVFPEPQPDGILQLTQDFRADPREGKIDLGVGVFRDDSGATPIMAAVREAEGRLLAARETKAYIGLLGDVAFAEAITNLALGAALAGTDRLANIQTPGGTGALRLGFDLILSARPEATVWVPGPTWLNHIPLITRAGLKHKVYPYYNAATGAVDFEAMMEAVAAIPAGDVILLHGCCHNPSGADLDLEQWRQIAAMLASGGVVAFVDMAYQGFGDGPDPDAAGLRTIFSALPEALMGYSCSKSFGLYRERTGLLCVQCETARDKTHVLGQMKLLARTSHSMPPDHGAAVVSTILRDDALRADWLAELDGARLRVVSLRSALAEAFGVAGFGDRFDFLKDNKGMFSLLGIGADAVARLRERYGVYMPASGRINIAGLQAQQVSRLVEAISDCLETEPVE